MDTDYSLLNSHDISVIITELATISLCSILLYKGITNYYDNVEKILDCKNKKDYIILYHQIIKSILMMIPFFCSILIPTINF
mgnify:FL=1